MLSGSVVLQRFVTYIINPAILLIFAAGFFLFMWGLVVFLYNLREGNDYKQGVQTMVWGLVGMLIMMSMEGIVYLISNTLQLDLGRPDMSRIQNVGPASGLFGN